MLDLSPLASVFVPASSLDRSLNAIVPNGSDFRADSSEGRGVFAGVATLPRGARGCAGGHARFCIGGELVVK